MSTLESIAEEGFRELSWNQYPGRLIVAGFLDDRNYIQLYALMGRSPNSRNRRFEAEGSVVRTTPRDPSKVEDPSLIIYNAMRERAGFHIVSNGHQTDTIYDCLADSEWGFEAAMIPQCFEPDAPHHTSRISTISNGIVTKFAIVSRGVSGKCERALYTYKASSTPPGFGRCVHTYAGNGNPLPPFNGRPFLVPLDGKTPDAVAVRFWNALNCDTRVALVVKCIDFRLGTCTVHTI